MRQHDGARDAEATTPMRAGRSRAARRSSLGSRPAAEASAPISTLACPDGKASLRLPENETRLRCPQHGLPVEDGFGRERTSFRCGRTERGCRHNARAWSSGATHQLPSRARNHPTRYAAKASRVFSSAPRVNPRETVSVRWLVCPLPHPREPHVGICRFHVDKGHLSARFGFRIPQLPKRVLGSEFKNVEPAAQALLSRGLEAP